VDSEEGPTVAAPKRPTPAVLAPASTFESDRDAIAPIVVPNFDTETPAADLIVS
jgi:hypothetical protein